jgi:hypothetical protein
VRKSRAARRKKISHRVAEDAEGKKQFSVFSFQQQFVSTENYKPSLSQSVSTEN